MTVALTGNGGLFTVLGHIMGAMTDILALEGGTATTHVLSGGSMIGRYAQFQVDEAYSPTLNQILDGFYSQVGGWQSSQSGFLQQLATIATNRLILQVNADTPLPALTLPAALKVILAQMNANTTTINASTISIGAQTAVGTPNGNPAWAIGSLNSFGAQLDTLNVETLTLACTQDSVTGGQTLNQERLSITGQAAVSSPYAYNWPGGSGVSASVQAVDASTYSASTQLLANGSFEVFSNANVPDNWAITTGTAGTQILKGTTVFDGTYSLEFAGDGSNLTTIYQPFLTANSTSLGAGGTPAALKPSTIYAVNCWIRTSATPSAGVLTIGLVNGSNTAINNSAGNANTISQSLTGISTTWVPVTGFFQTPAVMPAAYRLQIALSTALSSGKNLFIDRLALTPAVQIYQGGPPVAVFSGNTKLILGDSWTSAITNTFGKFALNLERVFSLRSQNLFFPSTSSSPTVADSLLV